ncbi:hypothetical protein QBC46DRAFT_358443 [Diplogelasinospora grovesii]|uniref:Uncharacterized protein n=1 Tax=Diplogelasinospora grovesii TaxID=303347 RepID=A0AAN6RZR0_9PEZI|nr:hypothetical protein QBC46DRAFT_358443 [Diplogelasinospora grovesii]
MSKVAYAYSDDKAGDELPKGAPEGQVNDPSYKTSKNEAVPVIDDDAPVEDPMKPGKADSDAQLEKDEKEAIDKSNIMKDRTRHAKPGGGAYKEPTDKDMGLVEGS